MDPKRSLSEMTHLFLSEVRNRQTGGAARPTRMPPRAPDVSIDMTPEEFEAACSADSESTQPAAASAPESKSSATQISIVLASHLPQPAEHVRQYARHLAAQGVRIGLIELDSPEFALRCFEPHGGEAAAPMVLDELDPRKISESLAELSFDVERWLINLPNPRSADAREILRAAPHWILLTTTDHTDVVATYRALKGLAEIAKPRLSLAVLDTLDDAQTDAVFHKLDTVSRQFLFCPMEPESPVRPANDITEHYLLHCHAGAKIQSPAPQWKIVFDFLSASMPRTEQVMPTAAATAFSPPSADQGSDEGNPQPLESRPVSQSPRPAISSATPRLAISEDLPEVIDLQGDGTPASILNAVIRQGGADGQWVQCPIHPPMCPQAALAVGRDRRLILLAITGRGLLELRSIGLALRWMNENRELIRMALPQLSLDAAATPHVRLFVDHVDLTADVLQPLLQSSTVTVHAYRKLKWGPKTGLLLEAA